jgi:hypothetical protein
MTKSGDTSSHCRRPNSDHRLNASMPVAMRPISEGGGARRKFSLDIISAKVQIDSNRTSRKAFEFPILTLIGTPLSVPRGSSASAGRTALAWEDTMVNADQYRTMALQHHRWAGMCRSPESREEHFRLEKELLVLADNEERLHGLLAPEQEATVKIAWPDSALAASVKEMAPAK